MTAPREESPADGPAHGPLTGVRVLELGGIGPGPFAGMLLGDLGAEVIRIDRPEEAGRANPHPILHRNRRSITVDLKHPDSADVVLALAERVDAVIEGFRPGVAERLGFGPEALTARNPRLVYGRMTGWGQDGPLASEPGHDINFIALTGVLHAIGTAGEPVVPLNLIADMGGGGMLLAMGLLAGITSARSTGRGQVVDAAMSDGAATLMAMVHGFRNAGQWRDRRQDNLIDGASPCYTVYRCADGGHVALGVGDQRCYASLLEVLDLAGHPDFADRNDRSRWPRMRAVMSELFAGRERDEWAKVFEGRGACVTPVLSTAEAPLHPHNDARHTFLVDDHGAIQPAPAPRYSATPAQAPLPAPAVGADTDAVLRGAGLGPVYLASLKATGVVAQA